MCRMAKLSDLKQDGRNANRGTERGRHLLETSLANLGAGRSILIDKHGNIIAGNKTAETASAIGLEDVIIVQSDGTTLVAVQRTDIDINSEAGRMMAYADNRVSEIDYSLDIEELLIDMQAGLPLADYWHEEELDALIASIGASGTNDPYAEWQGMLEFEQTYNGAVKMIKVHFASMEDLADFSKRMEQPITDKTIYIWHPRQQRENLQLYQVKDDEP